MQRNFQNLERLYIKYQTRYGHEDDVTKNIWHALETQKSQDSLRPQWNAHYPRIMKRLGEDWHVHADALRAFEP